MSPLAFVGNTQCRLGDELAGIGSLDKPGQIHEWRDPNSAGLQTRRQLVEELLREFGREPRKPPLRISTLRRRQAFRVFQFQVMPHYHFRRPPNRSVARRRQQVVVGL